MLETNKIKSCFFEKTFDKVEKPLAELSPEGKKQTM